MLAGEKGLRDYSTRRGTHTSPKVVSVSDWVAGRRRRFFTISPDRFWGPPVSVLSIAGAASLMMTAGTSNQIFISI